MTATHSINGIEFDDPDVARPVEISFTEGGAMIVQVGTPGTDDVEMIQILATADFLAELSRKAGWATPATDAE